MKKLQSDLQSSSSSGKFDFGGLDGLQSKFAEIKNGLTNIGETSSIKTVAQGLKGLGKGAVGAGAAIGGLAVVVKTVDAQIDRMIQTGMEAEKQFQRTNVTLTNLDRNLGGAGRSFDSFTKELQLMAANGVNSVDELNSAAQ